MRLFLRGLPRVFRGGGSRRMQGVFGAVLVMVLAGVTLFYALPTRAVPGEFAVYRENGGLQIITTSAATMDFDQTVSEGTAFSIDGGNQFVTLAEQGHYLVMYNLSYETVSGTNRSELQARIDIDGWDMPYGRGSCYLRRTNAIDECWLAGAAIIESTSTDQQISIESYKTDSNGAGVRRRSGESGVMLVRLDDAWPYARMYKTSGQAFNSAQEVWSTVTWQTEDELDSAYSHASGAVTLSESGLYLVTSNLHYNDTTRRNMGTRITLNGYELPGTRVTAYTRGTNSTHDHVASWVGVIEATTTNQVLRLEGACVGGTCGGVNTIAAGSGFTLTKLPSTANVVRLSETNGWQAVDGTNDPITWDTAVEVDSAAFAHSLGATSSRVTIKDDGDYMFFGSFYSDRATTTSNNRQQPHWEWRTNGSSIASYGSFAKYNRGNQSGAFQSGASGGVLLPGLLSGDYVELLNTDESTTDDPINQFLPERTGLQGIRLESLISPDIIVSAVGAHTSTSTIPNTDFHIGTFLLSPTDTTETVTDISIREQGTVDASSELSSVRLYYDVDTTEPYNCASVAFDGGELQFGATSTFPSADGSITFSDSVSTGSTSPMCVYVVADVETSATDSETVRIEIADPFSDVVLDDGLAGPLDLIVTPSGYSKLVDDELTMIHYHWRLDNQSEALADSATAGVEDTVLFPVSVGQQKRLRIEVSNEGSTSSPAVNYRLEFAKRESTCAAIGSWTDVSASSDAIDMYDTGNLTDSTDTSNISAARGGVSDENTTFLTPNSAVKDTGSQTGAITLTGKEYLELEYSIIPTVSTEDGATYCFRVTDVGTALAHYDVYAELTIAADMLVFATGTQPVYTDTGTDDLYMGGAFVIQEQTASRTVQSIKLTENGSVDAANDLSDIRMLYEFDTSDPYNCESVSYNGNETQYGATSSAFTAANGTATFNGSVEVSTTSAMCVYTVLNVDATANNGDVIELEITNPNTDITVSSGSVNPAIPEALTGSTTIRKARLEQMHYHWREDDGTEAGASSATGGTEDTPITQVVRGDAQRVRFGVSNEGATTSTSTVFSLQYGEKITSCSAVSWKSIAQAGGEWTMSDTPNLTDGADTTNLDVADGGVSDENTVFLSTNGGVRDTAASTSALYLQSTNFVDLEFSVEATPQADFGSTYCFRLLANGSAMMNYAEYPQATLRPNQDFYIQRGSFQMNTASTTITAGSDYVAPSASTSAFIRITNSQHTGAGRSNLGSTQFGDDVTVHILDPSNIEDSVTFIRANSTMGTYVAWEIVEYTGPVGGDNEILVHAAETMTMGSAVTTDTLAVSGVTNDNDVVVFITGQSHGSNNSTDYEMQLATADWLSGTDEAELTRTASAVASTWSVAVVEFTGVNWIIQRAEHNYSAVDTWETEAIVPVNDIGRAFLHVQKRVNNGSLANHGHEIYLHNASTVRFLLDSQATSAGNHTSVAWVIENTQTNGFPMYVHRSNGTQNGGTEALTLNVDIGTTTRDLTTTSIFLNNRTTGTGTAFPRAMIGATVISTTTYQIYVSDTGQTRRYRTEIVDWPTAELTLTQNYYRFYVDNGVVDPTDAWPPGAGVIGENTPVTGLDEPPANGDRVRIRMTVAVSGSNLSKEHAAFALQYGVRETTCTAVTKWHQLGDIASTTAVWRGYNAAPLDGTALSVNPVTPGDLNISIADRAGTYEEQNATADNPFKVFMGEDVEYDWNVQANGVTDLTSYCFRMTEESGAPLDEYVYYPTITTVGFILEQHDWRWYNDELVETPLVALAASNTAPSNIVFSDPLKLRVLVSEGAGRDGADTKFKLQWSEFSDFSVVNDVADRDTCSVGSPWCYFDGGGGENATITSAVLEGADTCVAGVGSGCGTHNEYSYVPDVVGEVGTTSTDTSGTTVTLKHTYDDPIFVVEALTGDETGGSGNDPAAAIITATTSASFTVRVQEPDNEADDHGTEEIAYIVMERGAYELPDGRKVDVNSTTTTHYYGNAVAGASDDTCVFVQTFTDVPVVFTALQSDNNTGTPDFLTASQLAVTANDFTCAIEVPDGETNAPGSAETIGWIAIEGGAFTNNDIDIIATTTTTSITGWTDTPWYEALFPYNYFARTPGILGSKQTRHGAEGGWMRYDEVDSESFQLAFDERDDGERTHTSEQVGYLALSEDGVLYRGGDSGYTLSGGAMTEFEFTLVHNNARPNQTYFFRMYDVSRSLEVAATTTKSHPSLSTEGATLTFSIGGYSDGSNVEGVMTDIMTTATSVPFGSLGIGIDTNAAQQFTVSTNATQGYQVLAYERQDLTAGGGATIDDIAGTNLSPTTWSAGCLASAASCYGYHVGDNTLAGGSTRFLVNDTYAALTGSLAEVAYSSGPVTNESTDIVYRIQANSSQPAGQYESKLVFIVVPVF